MSTLAILSLISNNYNKATLLEALDVLPTSCVNPYNTFFVWCLRLDKEAVSTTHQAIQHAQISVWHADTDTTMEAWQLQAEALALADSSAFRQLQRSLNAFDHPNAGQHLQHLEHALQSLQDVMGLPGTDAAVQLRTSVQLLPALLQRIKSELGTQTNRKELWKLLRQSISGLAEWRQAVLFAWDGLGHSLSDASAAQMSKAVRLFVDGQYVVDALDGTDLVCQFLQPDSMLAKAIAASPVGQISLSR